MQSASVKASRRQIAVGEKSASRAATMSRQMIAASLLLCSNRSNKSPGSRDSAKIEDLPRHEIAFRLDEKVHRIGDVGELAKTADRLAVDQRLHFHRRHRTYEIRL